MPDGRETALLAPYPVEAAPLGEHALERMRLLGVRTLGDLGRLPEAGVRARFGDEGLHAHRLARGLDPSPLAPKAAPPIVEAEESLESAVESLDVLLFHLRALCDRVIGRLEALGLACWEVRLEVRIENVGDGDEGAEIPLRLSRPTLSGRALWTLLRLRLERLELAGPVEGLRLAVVDAPPARAEQRALFRAVRDEDQLEAVVERLRARFGAGAAVSPLVVEVHRPEARVGWREYQIEDRDTGGPKSGRDARGPGNAGVPPALHSLSERDVRVLRIVSPPVPLTAEEREGRIVCFTGTGLRCLVARVSQPYRVSGEWWTEEFSRDYYIVLTRDGRLLWVFMGHRDREWYVHGWFD